MSEACIFITAAQTSGPGFLTVALEATSAGDPAGNHLTFGFEVPMASSAQQMRTAIVDIVKTKLADAGFPVVGNEAVVVFGGIS